MNAAQYTENSTDFEKIRVVSLPKPTAVTGEVVIKISAASINPVDAKVYAGAKKAVWPMPLPFTPGYDISGVVESVSDENSPFKVGDEVYAVNWGYKGHGDKGQVTVGGAFAEYIAMPANKLSLKPSNVRHETAAALALAGSTAMEALNEIGVTQGTKILILGGAGAVGAIAIQLAKLRGAWVATTASTRTMDYVQQFGADHIINYTEKSWWLEADTQLSGFDAVFDSVGEAQAFAHAQTEGVVKHGGSFISIASPESGVYPTAHQPRFNYAAVFTFSHDKSIQDELISLVSEGRLKVPIDSVFPFTQQGVLDIFTKVKSGKSLGKNVLQMV